MKSYVNRRKKIGINIPALGSISKTDFKKRFGAKLGNETEKAWEEIKEFIPKKAKKKPEPIPETETEKGSE